MHKLLLIELKEVDIMKFKKVFVAACTALCIGGALSFSAFAKETNPAESNESIQNVSGLINGLTEGLKSGLKNGLTQGLKNGLTEGLKSGVKEGMKSGLKNGELR